MTEFELIARLTRDLPAGPEVVVGPGDDCAVLDLGLGDRWLLFKTDAVVEGIHFTPEVAPERVGHKALARCLSDVAAMAGDPRAALVTVALPRSFEAIWVEAMYRGLRVLADRTGVFVVGGETTTNPGGVLISVAVLGTVAKDRCILRRGARPGDALFVTGELGGSLMGRHLDFEPRLEEARWLAQEAPVHAMIDLSDGLAGDLRHLLDASGVGAELRANAIPIGRAARHQTRTGASKKPPLLAALTDGEDFELLFAVPSASAVPLLDAWKRRFPGIRLSCIGKTTQTRGVRLCHRHGVQTLEAHGYTHFAEPR